MPAPITRLDIDLLAAAELRLERWAHQPVALPCWRLYWNPRRGARVIHDGVTWHLGPDRILLIAPETVYTAEGPPRPHRHVFVHFTVAGTTWQPPTGVHRLPVDDRRRALVEDLRATHRSADDDPDGLPLAAAALGTHALAALPAARPHRDPLSDPIRRCIAHLSAYYDRQVDNRELADLAGMHVNSLTRRFRAATGLSPQAWHHRHRIERAGLELARSDAPIEDIATTFGYCDRHHFSRVFKRLRGRGPANWRRAVRAAQQ